MEELKAALSVETDERKRAKLEKKMSKLAKFMSKMEIQKNMPKKENQKEKKKLEFEEGEFIPEGEKKTVTKLNGQFNPKTVENGWFSWWNKEGFFTPEYKTKACNGKMFSIVLPPPNVTGSLHLGHAMMASIEDTLVRWKRMQGYKTLYLPGTDHAGIATQVVVEKSLEKQGIYRKDMTREAFLEKVWEWKNQYGSRISEQFKSLGTSLDFTREKFTMDADVSLAVTEAFVRFYEEGLIYRGNRLSNWCAKIQTSLSDLEVDYKMVEPYGKIFTDGKEYVAGRIFTIKYSVEVDGKMETIHVQTTRPETIFGDVALCANPNDSRYAKFKGSSPINPLTQKKMQFVFDEAADMSFGTGVLKITPAHDHVDFEVGEKHNLEMISILDINNRMTIGPFKGLLRFDAREETVKLLKELGVLVKEEGHSSNLPICSRTGEVIEPRLTPQWWMNCQKLAKKALEASQSGELKIVPEEMNKTWEGWLLNIKDWCLSRQLWWGHRIPAYVKDGKWYIARSKEEAEKQAGGPVEQEEDVLDTWFSSGLWPFSTLGWPNETEDLKTFYPTSLLETGKDIIFFWVARMVMMGIALTGKCPFKMVLFHSIVRDAKGEKMSKSKGNVIDPVDVISGTTLENLLSKLKTGNLSQNEVEKATVSITQEYPAGIEACGSDALRYALLSSASLGRDVNLSIDKVLSCRRFCNKIWNGMKFALSQKPGEGNEKVKKGSFEDISDRWIESRFNKAITSVNGSLESSNFMKAAVDVHQFMVYEFCDFYLELFKGRKDISGINTLRTVSLNFIKLIHPLFPFLTEEIYQAMKSTWEIEGYTWMDSITVEDYPAASEDIDEGSEDLKRIESIIEFIKDARSKIATQTTISKAVIKISKITEDLAMHQETMKKLIGVEIECTSTGVFNESAAGIEYSLV
ncbi:valyl-tRNA synthetase [Nematocida sp. ERTm5]|nr:valyl-tRNA synthetase [Nematocida sp. ERTm5]